MHHIIPERKWQLKQSVKASALNQKKANIIASSGKVTANVLLLQKDFFQLIALKKQEWQKIDEITPFF